MVRQPKMEYITMPCVDAGVEPNPMDRYTSSTPTVTFRITVPTNKKNALVWMRKVRKEVDMEGGVASVIAALQAASEGLNDATVDKEAYGYKYDPTEYTRHVLTGWADDVTEDQRSAALEFKARKNAEDEARRRQVAERELLRIAEQFPDLV